jgi:hypothetical protein
MPISQERTLRHVRAQILALFQIPEEPDYARLDLPRHRPFIVFMLIDEVLGTLRLAAKHKDSVVFQDALVALDALFERMTESLHESRRRGERREFIIYVNVILAELWNKHSSCYPARAIQDHLVEFTNRCALHVRRAHDSPLR